MFDHRTVAFRMPSGLPAVSATFLNDGTFASVDGFSCSITVFSASGKMQETHDAVRAYRTIRSSKTSPTEGLLFALGDCRSGTPYRVYLLNCRFEEVGSIDLISDKNCSCECAYELSDIAPDGESLHATFRRGIRTHDLNGAQTGVVLPPDCSRVFLRYTVSGTARALAFCKNGVQFINLAEIGAVYLAASPDGLAVRDLVPYGIGDVYGLFGYRYLYNYLMPIYRNGAFCLPTDGNIASVLQNICPCS